MPSPSFTLGADWNIIGCVLKPRDAQLSFLLGEEADGSYRMVQTVGGVVQVSGGTSGATFTDASVAPDGATAAQPTSATQLGYWNGTGFLPVQAGQGLPTQDATLATAQAGSGLKVAGTLAVSNAGTSTLAVTTTPAAGATQAVSGTVADSNSAAWQGAVQLTPGSGNPAPPARGLGFICTAAGTLTMTLANGSTMTFPIATSANLQTLDFAVTGIALSGGAAGTFWNLV